jgi:hypothetical protein
MSTGATLAIVIIITILLFIFFIVTGVDNLFLLPLMFNQ